MGSSRGLRNLADKRCRRHLTACHTVDCVVYKYNRNIFASRRRVNGFRRTDSGKVAVALIGENERLGKRSFYARCNRRRSAVSRLLHIALKIVIRKNTASYRRNAYRLALDTQLVYNLGNQTVHNAVRTAGAVVKINIAQSVRFCENLFH